MGEINKTTLDGSNKDASEKLENLIEQLKKENKE